MFVKLCDKNILPVGELKAFKVKGHEVFAVNVGDKIFSLDARCTHAGAPLAEGTLKRRSPNLPMALLPIQHNKWYGD